MLGVPTKSRDAALKFIVVFKIKTLNIMILPFVGFISLTPPVGTPLLLRGALQTDIWAGNVYFLSIFSLEK